MNHSRCEQRTDARRLVAAGPSVPQSETRITREQVETSTQSWRHLEQRLPVERLCVQTRFETPPEYGGHV